MHGKMYAVDPFEGIICVFVYIYMYSHCILQVGPLSRCWLTEWDCARIELAPQPSANARTIPKAVRV